MRKDLSQIGVHFMMFCFGKLFDEAFHFGVFLSYCKVVGVFFFSIIEFVFFFSLLLSASLFFHSFDLIIVFSFLQLHYFAFFRKASEHNRHTQTSAHRCI